MSSYDSAGNLLVNVAVGGGGGGGGGSVNIADPTTPAQKLAVDASGKIGVNSLPALPANQSVNVAQIGGVATQMATANGVAYTNIPETALGLDNGTSLDKLVGLNGFASIEQMIAYYIRKGQGFSATTGIVTSGATAGLNGISVFNPVASGKTLVIYSLKSFDAGATQPQTNLTISDPAYGTALPILNNKPGSATTSVASASTSAAVIALTGTVQDVGSIAANVLYEVFTVPGRVLVLAPGNGISHAVYVAATAKYGITLYWIEY